MSHPLVVHKSQSHDVYIGRPSEWGNPFVVGVHGTRGECCDLHRKWIDGLIPGPNGEKPPSKKRIKRLLRGRRLGCFCAPRRCHGDYLAYVANEPAGIFDALDPI